MTLQTGSLEKDFLGEFSEYACVCLLINYC